MIGGLAVSARIEFRFTRDIDLMVAVDSDRDAERIVGRLLSTGYEMVSLLEQTATDQLSTTRLLQAGEERAGVIVDLLFASSGIEPEVVAAAQPLDVFPGFRVPVAQTGHLIALKVLSRDDETRLQNLADLQKLLAEADEDDLAMARTALALMAGRGFDRGKNLQADLDELIDRFRRAP